MNQRNVLIVIGLLFSALACNLPTTASTQTVDLLATLQALTPASTNIPASLTDGSTGKIAFTCQIFEKQSSEQICLMNADGTGFRRLTTDDNTRHYYPSISPDGQVVVYSGFNTQTRRFEIYEYNLVTNEDKALTYAIGDLNAPEISPDGKTIAFTRFFNDPEHPTTWVMNRDGSNPHEVSGITAWDPTWSPDGKQILFASYANDLSELFIINADGTGAHQISHLPDLRGRSDWSPQNLIVTYSGKPWYRELFTMNVDGSNQHQLTLGNGNSQGPSFSPDGQWVTFTAYFDKYGDSFGCEIYIMRVTEQTGVV